MPARQCATPLLRATRTAHDVPTQAQKALTEAEVVLGPGPESVGDGERSANIRALRGSEARRSGGSGTFRIASKPGKHRAWRFFHQCRRATGRRQPGLQQGKRENHDASAARLNVSLGTATFAGWVEPKATPMPSCAESMGIAALNPSYGPAATSHRDSAPPPAARTGPPLSFSLREKVPAGRMREGLSDGGVVSLLIAPSLIRRFAPPSPGGRRNRPRAGIDKHRSSFPLQSP